MGWQRVRDIKVRVRYTETLGRAAGNANNLDHLAIRARLGFMRAPAGRPNDDVIPSAQHTNVISETIDWIERVIGHRRGRCRPLCALRIVNRGLPRDASTKENPGEPGLSLRPTVLLCLAALPSWRRLLKRRSAGDNTQLVVAGDKRL
jgi:hypothetical protein